MKREKLPPTDINSVTRNYSNQNGNQNKSYFDSKSIHKEEGGNTYFMHNRQVNNNKRKPKIKQSFVKVDASGNISGQFTKNNNSRIIEGNRALNKIKRISNQSERIFNRIKK